jgi:hypothetical protein
MMLEGIDTRWSCGQLKLSHFTNAFPLGVGIGLDAAIVGLSAYVVMLGLPLAFQETHQTRMV